MPPAHQIEPSARHVHRHGGLTWPCAPAPRTFEFEIPLTQLPAGGTATADLTLQRMAILDGQVFDAAGKPEAGALVAVKSNSRDGPTLCWSCSWSMTRAISS